jgi:hypothetical protein
MKRLSRIWFASFSLTAFGAIACSATGGTVERGSGGSPATDGGSQNDAAIAAGGAGGTQNTGGVPSSGGLGFGATANVDSGPTEVGLEQTCDGIDDNGNGIVDDVDVAGDGVCDCLRIATAGRAGYLGSGVFAEWLSTRSPMGSTDLGDQVLTAELLAGFQVLVLQDLSARTEPYSTEEAEALHDWVEAGGGLMTLTGYAGPTEVQNVNALLATMGLSYQSDPVLRGTFAGSIPVTEWIEHPVTDGVEQIGVDNGHAVAGSGTTLAVEGGVDVLKALEVGDGKVLVWGDEWITFDSEWRARTDYQVERFWLNAFKWLTPERECQVEIPPVIR